jgi:hypothetical protein
VCLVNGVEATQYTSKNTNFKRHKLLHRVSTVRDQSKTGTLYGGNSQ